MQSATIKAPRSLERPIDVLDMIEPQENRRFGISRVSIQL